jgi:ABC-type dipeptide/oligopeptide/nickel transport system permease component
MSFQSYIVRRTLGLIPKLTLASVVVFMLVYVTPGDPIQTLAPARADPEMIAQLEAQWRLNEPIYVQYLV